MERQARVGVLPVVFALVVLSVPAQMVFTERYDEPYPGLFQPFFYGVSPTTEVKAVELTVDDRPIEPFDLFPADGPARGIVASMFPPEGGEMRVDDKTRRSMRATLARHLGVAPRELMVTWESRRVDRDTGTVSDRSILARYRLDLTGRVS